MEAIRVQNLSKNYRIATRPAGIRAAARQLFHPQYSDVPALSGLSFEIEAGEMVGLIGPNGAGKTTCLKILAGLLHPTSGFVSVHGFTPALRDHAYLRQMSMVIGNKSQMIWDIPPLDSFQVLREIYAVDQRDYQNTLDELIQLLQMETLLQKPVRSLSLGERMKCELTAALLHRPKILFLDEPTLGLDISTQIRLRAFLKEYNQRHAVTMIITSHYMDDVQALCSRVILIHHGQMLYNGQLSALARQIAPYKIIKIKTSANVEISADELPKSTELISQADHEMDFRVAIEHTAEVIPVLLQVFPVTDLTIEEPPIEAVIDKIYSEGQL